MLTVPGLCWLCRMPLALGHWGICSVCSRAARTDKTLCPQCGLPATHSHLPCGRCLQKPLPWQRLLTVADYAPPLSPLIHQLKFSRRSEIASALSRLLLLEVLHARRTTGLQLPDRIISVRYGSAVTGVGDLIRAICCVSRYHAGYTANGIAKPSHEHGPPRPSIFLTPGYANTT